MQLSKRLTAVANMVTSGLVLADIGTDHAYIPIYLVENQVIPHAIAADVNRGPLLRAEAHIREHGLQDRIETRLSDGLTELHPGEAQSILIAGMGGALTVRILQNGIKLLNANCAGISEMEAFYRNTPTNMLSEGRESVQHKRKCYEKGNGVISELILQPQSEIPQVRAYLEQSGWEIVQEDMVFEDGKYYPMMKANRARQILLCSTCNGQDAASSVAEQFSAIEESSNGSETRVGLPALMPMSAPMPVSAPMPALAPVSSSASMSDLQLEFGPKLLEMRHPVLREYLLREQKTQERILESLRKGKSEMAGAREQEIHVKVQRIEEALRLYE